MEQPKFVNLKFRKRLGFGGLLAVLLVGGVAFALLQSRVTMTGNSISTSSTGLLISQNDTNYSNTTTGYSFAGIVPGSKASQTEHFMLKNTGSSPLQLKMDVSTPPTNISGVDLSKVQVVLIPYSTTTFMPGTPQSFPLQTLLDAGPSGLAVNYPSPLAIGTKEEFNIQMSMDADAVSSSSAVISNLDLGFTGVATN